MNRFSIGLTDDQLAYVEERTDETTSRADVIRSIIDTHRTGSNRTDAHTEPDRTEPVGDLRDRVDGVEADIGELCSRLEAVERAVQDEGSGTADESIKSPGAEAESGALSDGDGERMEHLAGDDGAGGGSGGEPDAASSDGADDERAEAAAARVREHFAGGGPQKEHVRRAVVAVVQHLATEGACKTAELKDVVMDVAGDHYAEKRNAWNSIDRYVADVPGVHKPDYGMWAYEPAADDEDALKGGPYDPTDEF